MKKHLTQVITILNSKGGVGKTSTAMNLAWVLGQKGYKVLAIDFDYQTNLTNSLNVGLRENEEYMGTYEFMLHELRPISAEDDEFLANCSFEELLNACICRPTYTKRVSKIIDGKKQVIDEQVEFGFDLMPSHIMLADYELELTQNKSGADGFRLKKALEKLVKYRDYDFILIDCSPSLGILNLNAISAPCVYEFKDEKTGQIRGIEGGILIPTNLDLLSTRGVENLIEKIAEVQELLLNMNPQQKMLGIIGINLSLYRERRQIDAKIKNNLEMFYPLQIIGEIPETVDAKKAIYSGTLLVLINNKAKDAFNALADNIIKRLKEMDKVGPQIIHLESNEKRKIGDINDQDI